MREPLERSSLSGAVTGILGFLPLVMRCRCQLRYGHTHVLHSKLCTRISSSSSSPLTAWLSLRAKSKRCSCFTHVRLEAASEGSHEGEEINRSFYLFYLQILHRTWRVLTGVSELADFPPKARNATCRLEMKSGCGAADEKLYFHVPGRKLQ